MRFLPFTKNKGGCQFAGLGYDNGGGGGSYILPPATASTLGGVKVGTGLAVESDGTLSSDVAPYTLPPATASTLGGVKVGTGLSVESDGTLSSTGGGFSVANNAGAHNSIYRGQSLGTSVTEAQYTAIQAGTFDDMFIGDYWTIDNVVYRIAAFDYWLNTGDTECTAHHVVLVPDACFAVQKMNNDNDTTGGYVGSQMYTTNLTAAKTAISSAFGAAHILTHREDLSTAVSNGIASSMAWRDSTVELMNEVMMYGCTCASKPMADSIDYNMGIDNSQLPLFALDHSKIINRTTYWLRSVVSASRFACVYSDGHASNENAGSALGVRPAFAIYNSQS